MSCLLVFAFAIVRDGRAPEGAGEGILWATLTFAGTLALGRTFERERQAETLRALLLAPVPRAAVYLGKLVGIVSLLLAVELILDAARHAAVRGAAPAHGRSGCSQS